VSPIGGMGSVRRVLTAGVAVVVAAALAGLLLARHGGSAAAAHGPSAARVAARPPTGGLGSATAADAPSAARVASTPAKYGGLPSWLPKPKVQVNRVVQASAAHAALATQGDEVAVDLTGGHALATAVGPEVPEEGRFPVPATTPCTFVVTFARVSGAVPLSAGAFTLVDEYGRVYRPRVTAMDGGPLPARAAPGAPLSSRVYDVLPTGDGSITWAPEGRLVAAWDFSVEID